jgi:hypothetical protein
MFSHNIEDGLDHIRHVIVLHPGKSGNDTIR